MSLVSKKTRYALHGLAYLAASAHDEAIPFDEILAYLRFYSGGLTLSPGYIAKIFQQISRAGFTEALPGPHGGYRLARPPVEVSLLEIIEALEGRVFSSCCLLSAGDCPQQEHCAVRALISQAEAGFHRFFEFETLESLAARMTFPDRDQLSAFGLHSPGIATR